MSEQNQKGALIADVKHQIQINLVNQSLKQTLNFGYHTSFIMISEKFHCEKHSYQSVCICIEC